MAQPLELLPIFERQEFASSEHDIEDLLTEAKIGPRDCAGRLAVVAMSGGVDSAVTALLMRERGYRVVGINLRLHAPEGEAQVNPCCGIPAMNDARATCALIGVPFYALNMETEFDEAVIDRFVEDYVQGRTPNPCLECNRHVKFRHLVERSRSLGATTLATGHYVKVVKATDRYELHRALDDRKDQSYVLYTLNQEQLAFIQFPLGNLRKTEVRQLARHFGLPVADKPESQDICFVGKGSYAEFVRNRRPEAGLPGEIVTSDGVLVGRHEGLVNHTIGQRRGLRVAGKEPLYVLRLEVDRNRVVVGSRDDAIARSLICGNVSFVDDRWPAEPFDSQAVVRYRGNPHQARITPIDDQERTLRIDFSEAGPVAAPGQAVVLYDDERVVGGGTILSTQPEGLN